MASPDPLKQAPKHGEHVAFDALYRHHADRVYGFCLRRTGDVGQAEEARAIVFLEAWRRRRDIDFASRPAGPWLYGVARNVLRNQRRALQRRDAALRSLGDVQRGRSEDVSEHVQRRQVIEVLLRTLQTLPPAQREVVWLCVLDNRSYEAAAGALQIPIGTVRSRLSRARMQLASAIHAAEDHVPCVTDRDIKTTNHNHPGGL
jgi:RNA polymerase sigma-70 factor (ECF subfamily)